MCVCVCARAQVCVLGARSVRYSCLPANTLPLALYLCISFRADTSVSLCILYVLRKFGNFLTQSVWTFKDDAQSTVAVWMSSLRGVFLGTSIK